MKKVKKELHFKDQVSKEGELIQNMILDHTMIGISWFWLQSIDELVKKAG